MVPTNDTQIRQIRHSAVAFMVAAAGTAVAGLVLFLGVEPSTDISDDMWRYPWQSSSAFVAFSIVSAAMHGLVALGLLAFGRSGAAGRSRSAVRGVALAVAGTCLLLAGELLSIPVRDAKASDTSAAIVGAVFGLACVVSTVGFIVAGQATMRAGLWRGWRRFTPLATGVSLIPIGVLGLGLPTLLPALVAVYGLCLLAMGVALYTEPAPRTAVTAGTFVGLAVE